MATLEKIRSKSVLLIVVIGVALLAFIIGDAITNSRNLFGDHTTVAKIGGEKIDYTEYAAKREELNNRFEQARRQNPAQYANFDNQLLSEMALEELVGEKLLDEAVANAGIQTSPEQLRFYILENPVNPTMQTIVQQLNASGLSVSTPQQAYEVIFNPKRNGLTDAQMAPFQRAWLAMEEETKQMVRRQTYQRVLYGLVKANDLDKKALYNDYVATSDVDIAFHPYGTLDAAKYPVDDATLSEEYAKIKNEFKIEGVTKDVAFVAVNIAPSAADRENARSLAQKTVAELRDSSGQLSKELKREGVMSSRKELRASDLPYGGVRDYVLSAQSDSVKLIAENIKGFTIVKMGKRSQVVDSVQLNIVQVVGANLPSKVLASLNSGLALDSLSSTFGDSVFAQKEQWIPLFTAEGRTNAIESSQLDSLMKAGGKYISLMTSPQGAVLAQVSKRNAPVDVYSFEEVNYELKPSTKTLNDERTKLEKFLDSNPTAKDFMANAAKAGYSVQDLSLSASSAAVPRMAGMQSYYPDSRQVVRWVMMDGKPGEVSHIYESKDALTPALYAVAVVDEYEDYAPLRNKDVKAYVTDMARRSKAGDDLIKQYEPKAGTIESAAAAMGVEEQNAPTFRFGRNMQVADAEVMGKIAGSKPDNKVVLVKGDNGVYAYVVKGNGKENFPFSDAQYEQQYFQLVNPNLGSMLRGTKEFKNNIYKFEAGD